MVQHDPGSLLSDAAIRALKDIRDVLRIPYSVQEYLSSDNAPTAPWVLSAYAEMLEMLELAKLKYPKLRHSIQASSLALKQYMAYTRQTRVYALAMSMPYQHFMVYVRCSFSIQSSIQKRS